jgi:predicted RNA-binding protein YlxR (DUF448 family)
MLARAHDDELDAGPHQAGPERLCVATRKVRPAADLIRFVVGPDGAAVPDLKQKLPGRGVWVTATRAAVEQAVRRGAFARGFKRPVQVRPDLAAETERLLERAVLDALAMAGKAGQVPSGFTKVETALAHDHVVGLIHAADAAPDGVRKLASALRRRFGERADRVAAIEGFTSQQLDLALGRANVIHAAVLAGPASETLIARYRRLDHFRTSGPEHDHRNTDRKQAEGL